MARIAESEIKRLKNEVSVERLIEQSGIALKKAGKDLIGCCPFHEDSTASLVITPAKNLWHCFGCGLGGGSIDWVMKKNGVSFRHAVELLREGVADSGTSSLAANDGTGKPVAVKRTTVRVLDAPITFDADDQALLGQVVNYYHDTLKQSPEALAYLASRGFSGQAAMEAITTFKLGYANRTLGLRLPQKNRVAGADIRTRLIKIGVYRESGHEHFNGSLVIPVLDANGHVQEIYGRKLLDNLRAGTPKHLYLPGPHRGIWNVAALQASQEIILCEALIDALTFWVAGYRNVTSSYGIEGFTDELLAAFKQHGTQRVLIAYDRDEAGERGAAKVAAQLMAAGIDCFRIQFPKGMDANDYALKVTPAAKSLGVVIRKALWLGNGQGNGQAPERPEAEPIYTALPDMVETAPVAAIALAASTPQKLPAPVSATLQPPIAEAAPLPVSPVLPASPMPSAPAPTLDAQVTDNEITLSVGNRRYRIRGLQKNLAFEVLKVNVLVSDGAAFHVDSLDLYSARQRASYVAQAAIELRVKEDVIKTDLGRVLLKLEAMQDEHIRQSLAIKPAAVDMTEAERAAALDLLHSPDLLGRILTDFAAMGLVGEDTNKLVGYLAAVSRKLDAPLAVVVQSSSAAGKSALMDAVLSLVPEEERVKYSAMTGQSLFYMGETSLKHKILAIAEEEGASRASYALKLLQSEGELTMASTGKDPVTGNLITQQYRVEGPVMIFLTTTAIEIDEELLNRCIVLSVDEGRAQTEAIHQRQRHKRTLAGMLGKHSKEAVLTTHRNAQRLLRPLAVVNPYADQLTFLSDKTRTRRDHDKYLTLIDTIALLHQYQRPVQTAQIADQVIEYIEVTQADIAIANRLAHDVLGRSLDELPPQTRRLLAAICAFVKTQSEQLAMQRADYRFSRRELRAACGWGDTQLRVHLERLTHLEYLLVHRGGRGQSFVYELLYDGNGEAAPHLSGLLDTATMTTKRGSNREVAGSSRPQHAPDAVASPIDQLAAKPPVMALADDSAPTTSKTHYSAPLTPAVESASYAHA